MRGDKWKVKGGLGKRGKYGMKICRGGDGFDRAREEKDGRKRDGEEREDKMEGSENGRWRGEGLKVKEKEKGMTVGKYGRKK